MEQTLTKGLRVKFNKFIRKMPFDAIATSKKWVPGAGTYKLELSDKIQSKLF